MAISSQLKALLTAMTLSLSMGCYAAPVTANTSGIVSDSVITAKVKSKLVADPGLSVFDVDVSTNNGVVTLVGLVNSDTDAAALIQLTQSTDGVKDVDTNKLEVKHSEHPIQDMAITAKVKGMFIREKLMGKNIPASVNVETNNGIVYLSGNVSDRQQVENAVQVAKNIRGVKNVESRLKVVGK